ncbi:MAG: hypothetical protein K9K67_08365 [Bacteriovoracaceae bacterium]|nr:hypothetical protein [Bacteriovoracaceae bacterium]
MSNQRLPFDIVYISYDEPNASENYQDLISKAPEGSQVLRVHGVKGLDESHRKAAELATTKHVLIVDGDNIVTRDFFKIDFNSLLSKIPEKLVLSWASKNIINGLIYGNGGLKLWPTEFLKEVNCHNNGKSTDWCQQFPYLQLNNWFSYCMCNGSPYQAFRAGFREGVKLCLNADGTRNPNLKFSKDLMFEGNRQRLLQWMSIGADVTNGHYAMFGARLGCIRIICEDNFDLSQINNYDWFNEYWNGEFSYVRDGNYLEHFNRLVFELEEFTGLHIANFNSDQSRAIKSMIPRPKRSGLLSPQPSDEEAFIPEGNQEKEV